MGEVLVDARLRRRRRCTGFLKDPVLIFPAYFALPTVSACCCMISPADARLQSRCHQGRNLGIFPIIFSAARMIRRGDGRHQWRSGLWSARARPWWFFGRERGCRAREPRPGVVTGAGGLRASPRPRPADPATRTSAAWTRGSAFTFRLRRRCVDVDKASVPAARRIPCPRHTPIKSLCSGPFLMDISSYPPLYPPTHRCWRVLEWVLDHRPPGRSAPAVACARSQGELRCGYRSWCLTAVSIDR